MGKNGRNGRCVCTIKATHSTSNGGFQTVFERLKKLSSQRVAVGIPSGKSKRADSDIDNADLIYIHTHGVRPKNARKEMQPEINKGIPYSTVLQMYIHEHGSIAYQVPPRPVIEPAIENAKKDLAELLKVAAITTVNSVSFESVKKDLENVGIYAENEVKNWFVNPKNGWAPNAASTIKAKGSDNPLIDTGALRNAITFVIQEDEK